MSLKKVFRALTKVDDTVPLTLQDLMTGEQFTLHVSLSAYNKAQADPVFATNLLNKHKAFLSEKLATSLASDETLTKPPVTQKELDVVDAASGNTYTLIVSEKQYDNGMKDPMYAKFLLKQKLCHNKDDIGEFGESVIQEYEEDMKVAEGIDDNLSPNCQSTHSSNWTSEQTKLLLALYEDESEKKDNRAMWKNIVQGMLLEQVFGKKKWANPLSVAGSNLSIDEFDKQEPSCKRQKAALDSIKLQYYQEGIENRRQQRELRERKTAALEKLAATYCKKN